MLKLLTATAIAALFACPALAADLSTKDGTSSSASVENWSGPGISVGVGGTFVNSEISSGSDSFSGIGSSGVEGAASGWYNLQRGNLVFGPAIEVRYGNVSTGLKSPGLSAGYEVDYRVAGLMRIGVAHGNTLVYGTGGIEAMGVSGTGLLTGSTDVLGWTAGGGIQNKMPGGMLIGLESRYTAWEDKSVDGVTLSPDAVSVTVSAGWQF